MLNGVIQVNGTVGGATFNIAQELTGMLNGVIQVNGTVGGATFTISFCLDKRERKIFCVYGKNSSLIRNRYV